MERKSMISRFFPKAVQREIEKSWLPFGNGMTDILTGTGSPVWLQSGEETMMKEGYMMNPDVYMIVNYITRLAAQIPWILYEVKDEKWLNRYKNLNPTESILSRLYETKALEPVENNHQIIETWKNPNERQGQAEFIEQLLGFKLVTGNTYMHGMGPITGSNAGLFIMFDILPSYLIDIKYGGPMKPVGWYYWIGDPNKRIDPESIIHYKYWSPLPINMGGLKGMSPLKAASRLVRRNNDSITASVKTLQNMGAIGMLSRYVGTPGEKGLTVEQANMIEQKYYEKYGGAKNAGKIMVTGAAVKWQQMGMSPVDLKIIEQEQVDLRKLCGIYGLQSQLFNDPENKSYNNMKEAKMAAYTNCVIPEMRSIRDELNRGWISQWSKKDGKNYWFDIDLQAIPELQTDFKQMMEWLKDAEMLTLNEKRDAIDYKELDLEGMDEIWLDGGKIPLSQAMIDPGPLNKWIDEKL